METQKGRRNRRRDILRIRIGDKEKIMAKILLFPDITKFYLPQTEFKSALHENMPFYHININYILYYILHTTYYS